MLQRLAWALYDFGNTAIQALVITFFFPVLILDHLGGNELQLGLVSGISLTTAAIAVPVIGAISDATGRRMPLLILFSLIAAAATIILVLGGLWWALAFAILGNFAAHVAIDLYDTKLAEIAPPERWGTTSGWGAAAGYLGVLASLGIAYAILAALGPESKRAVQWMFPTAAAFFLLFALPMFLLVRDRVVKVRKRFGQALRQAIVSVTATWRTFAKPSPLRSFLLASFLYNDALATVFIFLYLYASREVGLSILQFFWVFGLMSLAAAVGSLIGGPLTDRLGPLFVLRGTCAVWATIIAVLLFAPIFWVFVSVGLVGGLFWGMLWTATRPMLVQLAPQAKLAELFGFQGLTEKFGGIVGPVIFGALSFKVSYQAALLVVWLFFLAAFSSLSRVYVIRPNLNKE